eukprot:gnl/Chilomastix_caulleri/117.p1 GENE.gnl/Chilomastix_caulleri/117~~gnl/Chilomastix_caulleri/117.p1  ORF type:complete len:172 (-),score=63.02 gnl/Chilomastix_caulleri/117:68-508(-)
MEGGGEEIVIPAVTVAAKSFEMKEAIVKILKDAAIGGGVVRGLRQVVKALEQKEAKVVVLATDCDNNSYVALIKGLCEESGATLISDCLTGDVLGKVTGAFKTKPDSSVSGKHCSSAAITHFGPDSQELSWFTLTLADKGKKEEMA